MFAVEHVPTAEALFVLGGIERGNGVDHVELDTGSEPFEHPQRVVASECPDLDDSPRARRLDQRPDHEVPEPVHAPQRTAGRRRYPAPTMNVIRSPTRMCIAEVRYLAVTGMEILVRPGAATGVNANRSTSSPSM